MSKDGNSVLDIQPRGFQRFGIRFFSKGSGNRANSGLPPPSPGGQQNSQSLRVNWLKCMFKVARKRLTYAACRLIHKRVNAAIKDTCL